MNFRPRPQPPEMDWCNKHDVPYVGTCPDHDEEAKEAATYRRGLIDGLREAAQTVCKTLCTPELPIEWSEDYAAFVHIGALRSDVRCVANRVYKRIAELEAA